MDLADLIARVEAAQGPDRELDGDIWRVVNGWAEGDGWHFGVQIEVWHRRDPEDAAAFIAPPKLTASLDAAVSLVPGGCDWSCSSAYEGTAFASVQSVVGPYPRAEGYARAATPALALCAAALRARAEARGSQHDPEA